MYEGCLIWHYRSITSRVFDRAPTCLECLIMYQYNNYAYSSGVPGSQNVAAYSTRQSAAAAAAAASHNPFMTTVLPADDVGPRRVDEAAADRDLASILTSPSCRRVTPGGASSCLDRSSPDIVPPPPSMSAQWDRLTSPATRSAHLSNPPTPAGVPDGALYSSPLNRVAVRVDADDNDDDVRQQHARSHSAPAAPRHRHAAADHQHSGPPPPMWYVQSMSPIEKRTDVERRMLLSPPPPPSAAKPTPHDSTTKVRHRRIFSPSDIELNGPVADPCKTVVASPTTRRPNSVNIPPASTTCGSGEHVLTRRRLRAARGRLNLYTTGDCGFGSTLAGMAIVAGVALVFSVVGVQLLLWLTAASRRSATADATTETTKVGDSLFIAGTSRSDDSSRTMITRTVVEEVAVALAAVTVALDLCCLLTVSMQCFFAVKLAHCGNAESRFYFYIII